MKVKMLVCHDEDLIEPLVLGQDWIYHHAVNLNLRSQILQVWVHEQCITLELENCMLTNPYVTPSHSSSRTNLSKKDVVCVKGSMFQKHSIMEEQAQRQANSSCAKTNAVTTTQPKRKAQRYMTTAISNRQRDFKRKLVPDMKKIWVRKGEQPPALPTQFPPRQANHVKTRTKPPEPAQ
ncbi:hypothetical protein KP509_27G005400 [Ceratopteris richardii]|uniref:Uncharacterized protein n=1 Tax=Ceratopteris richardii TaxID=49495 RepID=A0A8T2RDJ8_CERRI|nr:hypothetical protein KP509_27G005400 [Ceratopteris richardii]